MGTNFYAVHIPTEDEIKNIHQKLDEMIDGTIGDWEFQGQLEALIDKKHLGKSSCGWQFLWAPNRECYAENLKSIKTYLSEPNIRIMDEYGDTYTFDQFFEEIGCKLYYKEGEYTDGYHYDIESKNYSYARCAPHEHITSDGLRFANQDDFS